MNPPNPIHFDVAQGLAHIELAAPERGNPISYAFVQALEHVTLQCADRRDVRAVLISAQGPRFSVGGDISEFGADLDDLPGLMRRWNASLNASVARLQRMNAPVVAAVHGVIAGGAVSILSGADILVAGEQARFVAAYASIGFCPDIGGTANLVRRIGVQRARRFHLMHEQLDAATAERIGLADFVVPTEDVLPRARAIAEQFARGPTLAYGEIKRLMLSAQPAPLEQQLELETQALVRLVQTEDSRGALQAFLDKRPPAYAGR
mgnify:CR=1 FL=1